VQNTVRLLNTVRIVKIVREETVVNISSQTGPEKNDTTKLLLIYC